jgi:hypothetical protein
MVFSVLEHLFTAKCTKKLHEEHKVNFLLANKGMVRKESSSFTLKMDSFREVISTGFSADTIYLMKNAKLDGNERIHMGEKK